jgi:hypothetical protein
MFQCFIHIHGAVVVVILWQLDLQLPMQSVPVPITTDVNVSSNLDKARARSQALVARTPPLPFSNFLFTNLFSIKFLYFFIISSLFPYFNLFVSISIQSYVNIKLHVSTLLDTILHKACNSAGLKIVSLLASITFIAPYFHYVIQIRTCIHS